ncbi:MAG TPA: presqualene diphosphate synthase HpnD [Methylomirabilota bacterium]|jgi:phytoene synthase|nr:presqualene diphosphate synthase HpnD [Methylomirabilota bacterium]
MSLAGLSSRVTRKSRSNFYYAFLVLPRPRREALYAVYAFCRTVDDIADLGTDAAAQRAGLAAWRRDIARCYEEGPAPEHPIARQLATAVKAFGLPRAALEAIVEGCEMDLQQSAYETFEDLAPYCYRVASAVGLCCIEVFGYTDPRAREYAVNLGMALQLTNIIRDVGADAGQGRIYVPQQDLKAFGVSAEDLKRGRHGDAFVRLMTHQAARAREHYAKAWAAFPAADARSLVPAEIMGRIYYALLEEIEARRFAVFGDRVTLSAGRKAAIAVRCWMRGVLGRAA